MLGGFLACHVEKHGLYLQGVFKKRRNFCYKDFIAHFTTF
jgi:hypothetical protein